jgi:Programmed cell death protein 2, C-terminal putative domain
MMSSKVQIVSNNDSDDEDEEDDDDELEKAFLENAMQGKKDEKRVEKILKNIKDTSNNGNDEDLLKEDPIGDSEEAKAEMKELEKIIEEKHSNFGKISRHYKLFEYVAKADPDQILRYVKQRSLHV